MTFAFERLHVYQKSMSLADEVCRVTAAFPRGYWFLVDQLNRAVLSVVTNLAEGNGRFTAPDRKHFFGIARGSLHECVPLLELAARQGLLDGGRHNKLKADVEEIARMISGLIRRMEKPLKGPATKR